MDFLDLMHTLFSLKELAPDMRWVTDEGIMRIDFEIPSEVEDLLSQGRQMFKADDLS